MTLPMWMAAGLLVAWGIWQAGEFKKSLVAGGATMPPVHGNVGDVATPARADGAPADGSGDVKAAADTTPQRDAWLDAMTPPGEDESPPDMKSVYASVITPTVNASSDDLIRHATSLMDAGSLVEARGVLNSALQNMEEGDRAAEVRAQLTGINDGVFLGTAILAEDSAARFVNVQPGDSFLKLGQKYAVPAALLETINPGINPRNLKPGTGIKIVQGPFHLRMFKGARRLDLYARDMYVRSFTAQVEAGDVLPRGTYRVSSGSKIQVSTRQWIGFEGTSDEARAAGLGWLYGEAGPRASRGQGGDHMGGIKMQDADLSQLYNALVETRSLLRVEP